jgi:hypothetical protein
MNARRDVTQPVHETHQRDIVTRSRVVSTSVGAFFSRVGSVLELSFAVVCTPES